MAELDDRVAALESQLRRAQTRLDTQEMLLTGVGIEVREFAEARDLLDNLLGRFNQLFPPADPRVRSYQPVRARDLRDMNPQESEEFGNRLRTWVQQVLARQLGYFALMLPACWEQHSLCLYALDILMHAWNYDYGQPRRNRTDLDRQGEYFIRMLRELMAMIATETKECHQKGEHVERDLPPAFIPALTAQAGGEAA